MIKTEARPEKERQRILLSLIVTLSLVAVIVIAPIAYATYQSVKETYISQIFEDNDKYAATVAFLIRDELKKRSKEEVIADINKNLDSYRVAKGGYICIYDSAGRLLVHPNQEWVKQQKNVGSNLIFSPGGKACQLIELVSKKQNYVGIYNSSLGEKQVGAFRYIEDAEWMIGVHQPYSNVQEVIDRIKFITVLATVSMIIFIPAISIVLMNKGIQPYYALLEEYSKKLEEKVEERTEELRESEEKYRGLVENFSDGIFVIDNGYKIIFCNKKMEEITGYKAEEIGGKCFPDLLTSNGVEAVLDNIERRPKSEQISIYELGLRRKSGEKRIIDMSLTRTLKEKGKAGWQGVIRDITEKKELERQVIQSEKLASVGKLAAGVAHEINNPLANISMYTHMLLKRAKKDEKIKKLKIILNQADRATKIVRNLLDFSRQSEPKMTEVNINELISSTLSIIKPQLIYSNIKAVINLHPDLPRISADPEQLQQVFINIINNAIEAMPKGGKLTITSGTNNNKAEIKIADTGIGISEARIKKIFDPFFTTKPTGKGTGLGLSVSLGIIERHHGTIEAESELGKGTTFIIRLPSDEFYAKNKDFNSRRRRRNA